MVWSNGNIVVPRDIMVEVRYGKMLSESHKYLYFYHLLFKLITNCKSSRGGIIILDFLSNIYNLDQRRYLNKFNKNLELVVSSLLSVTELQHMIYS